MDGDDDEREMSDQDPDDDVDADDPADPEEDEGANEGADAVMEDVAEENGGGQGGEAAERKTTKYLTKYERARVLGTRALQIRCVPRAGRRPSGPRRAALRRSGAPRGPRSPLSSAPPSLTRLCHVALCGRA